MYILFAVVIVVVVSALAVYTMNKGKDRKAQEFENNVDPNFGPKDDTLQEKNKTQKEFDDNHKEL